MVFKNLTNKITNTHTVFPNTNEKITLKIQRKVLPKIGGLHYNFADNSTSEEWTVRALIDCISRLLISVCEGIVVLLLDMLLLPVVLKWKAQSLAIYYTIVSVAIDIVIFLVALFITFRRNKTSKFNEFDNNNTNSINVLDSLIVLFNNSNFYLIFLVVSMTFATCYMGVPAEMFDPQ